MKEIAKNNQPLFKMCFFYLVDIDVEIDYMKMSDGTSPPPQKKKNSHHSSF